MYNRKTDSWPKKTLLDINPVTVHPVYIYSTLLDPQSTVINLQQIHQKNTFDFLFCPSLLLNVTKIKRFIKESMYSLIKTCMIGSMYVIMRNPPPPLPHGIHLNSISCQCPYHAATAPYHDHFNHHICWSPVKILLY